jgi:hypothetical protein
MYYTFKTYICQLVPGTRIELVIKAYQASVIPFNYPGKNMVEVTGIEPATFCLQSKRSPN